MARDEMKNKSVSEQPARKTSQAPAMQQTPQTPAMQQTPQAPAMQQTPQAPTRSIFPYIHFKKAGRFAVFISLLICALLPNAAFAQSTIMPWQTVAMFALTISFCIVGLIYIAGNAMNSVELKTYAHDELYQVIMSGILVVLFLAFLSFLDTGLAPGLSQATGGTSSLMVSAINVTDVAVTDMKGYLKGFEGLVTAVGREGSRSAYCSFLGLGMTVVSCSALNSMRGSLTMGLNAISFALADLYAQKWILQIANTTLVSVFLPLGILLRTLKFSRQAGGALLAIFFGFYIVFPTTIIFGYQLISSMSSVTYSYTIGSTTMLYTLVSPYQNIAIGVPTCNPFNPEYGPINNFAAKVFQNPSFYEPVVFQVIIRCVFLTALNLLITLSSIRAISSFLGSEIEVSGLVRIA